MKKIRIKSAMKNFVAVILVLGGILASCIDNDGVFVGPQNFNNGPGSPYDGVSTDALSSFFLAVGKGAAGGFGDDLTGWTLSALGLAGSSPDYENQINLIINELEEINELLQDIDNELITINQTLLQMNCNEQTSSIQIEVGTLNNLYNLYNGFLADTTDPIDTSGAYQWATEVIYGSSSGPSVGQCLSTMKANLNLNTGALVSCINTIPLPTQSGLGGDTSYYNQINAIVNYYYYYEAIGLFMLSEAYHYYAWTEAGQPGSTSYPADSVQIVCSFNSSTEFYCNEVEVNTNDLYNSLLTQLSFGGAPYTNEYTILAYSTNSSIIWVRSLEDFTSEAGFTFTPPLTNSNLVGPTVGYYSKKLTDTVYRGTSGFNSFADSDDLTSLFNEGVAKTYSSVGAYLESIGFVNMTGKTVISSNNLNIGLYASCGSYSGSALFFTDMKSFVTINNSYSSLFNNSNAFNSLYTFSISYPQTCDHGNGSVNYVKYAPNRNITDLDSIFLTAFASVEFCDADGCGSGVISPFGFTTGNYQTKSDIYSPGYSKYQQDNGVSPKRFLMPIVTDAMNVNCNSGRQPVNSGNMLTMCGEDMVIFLNATVPRPPTCDDTSINPPCGNP